MSNKKKESIKEYKLNHPPMGVYQIRNLVNEKVLVGSAPNLPGIFNRHKFALEMGKHANAALQADWSELGADKFAFEILDEISPIEGPDHDYRSDLTSLEEMWLEKLNPYGERGYNEKKMGSEERLRMIARNRSKES
jgi:group I intron endonuclease